MKILDLLFRFAMPALVLFTMIFGFALGHELAVIMLDPVPFSFVYNTVSGLIGTIIFSLILIKFSRRYFTKQFMKNVESMELSTDYVYEEAGNGIAIDLEKEKLLLVEQGHSTLISLHDVKGLESTFEKKNKWAKSVVNSVLHVYTNQKENDLVTVSYGLNSEKRDRAARRIEVSIASLNIG